MHNRTPRSLRRSLKMNRKKNWAMGLKTQQQNTHTHTQKAQQEFPEMVEMRLGMDK